MVEGGENDSFDTSVLRDDDELLISSGSDPSQFTGSQPFSFGGSQPFSIGGSQDDNIENFLSKAENDDDQVILRSPFRPSVPQSVRQISRDNMRHRSPEPQFYMPLVEVESPRRDSTVSGTTIRGSPPSLPGLRRRQLTSSAEPVNKGQRGTHIQPQVRQDGFFERVSDALPGTLYDVLAWILGVIRFAFRFAQKPIAIILALYLIVALLIPFQNAATRSLYSALSPVCRLPGASYLDLPFCEDIMAWEGKVQPGGKPVEFDGLMDVQDQFEQVLEKSAHGISLPMEMKRSEASIRDLRTMVRYSTLPSREELELEFDGFIDAARIASNDLQRFNTHVGSAVDSVISINRWTSRYLDGLVSEDNDRGVVGEWLGWLFSPFRPATFSESILLDKYIEHTALVSDKIAGLIVEAQAVLHTLSKVEDHLGIIHDTVTRTQMSVQSRKDEILSTLWSIVGANRGKIHNLNSQLQLLRQVNNQRSQAVQQVSELVVELEKIQAGLGDLRDRVAEPEIARGRVAVPLAVHIETINSGVDRLETARSRIRQIENERIREVLDRGKDQEERLIGAS